MNMEPRIGQIATDHGAGSSSIRQMAKSEPVTSRTAILTGMLTGK